jgi:hypothetical protein
VPGGKEPCSTEWKKRLYVGFGKTGQLEEASVKALLEISISMNRDNQRDAGSVGVNVKVIASLDTSESPTVAVDEGEDADGIKENRLHS